jgi:hypothetical protein
MAGRQIVASGPVAPVAPVDLQAPAPDGRCHTAQALENIMILKIATIAAALILSATSLTMAQAQGSSGPDGMTSAAASDNPPPPKHHKKMYMSAKSTHKKATHKTETNGGY